MIFVNTHALKKVDENHILGESRHEKHESGTIEAYEKVNLFIA